MTRNLINIHDGKVTLDELLFRKILALIDSVDDGGGQYKDAEFLYDELINLGVPPIKSEEHNFFWRSYPHNQKWLESLSRVAKVTLKQE